MSASGSLTWFAQHETRLAWRETMSMMTGGRPERLRKVALGVIAFVAFMHLVAYFAVGHLAYAALERDLSTLIAIMAGLLLSGSAILSQAMESVTRTFYTRSDLELILSSPARSQRLFAVRIGAIALSVGAMSLVLMGPFINVLAWQGGARWLGAYGVIVAVALVATALAVVMTVSLFQIIGPKRTRMIAQIAAALIGGMFVIGLQVAAMFSTGTMARFAFLQSGTVLANAPGVDSVFWWPARAALGDVPLMIAVVVSSVIVFVAVTALYAPRFANFAVAASGVSHGVAAQGAARAFRVEAASAALRRKERLLLIRDPWLLSQSLMQLLYLLPPALLLWHSYGADGGAAIVLVPVLAMAAGQLAGGLAWLTISGEDAPDLVLTAPVAQSRLLRAKIEAVMQCIAVVFLPFVAGLVLYSVNIAVIAAGVIMASAASATAIQFWFRAQAKRSQFRRRHTSSRIATFSEAFSSITWAATGAVAASGGWAAAIILVFVAVGILTGVRMLSPARR
ncbi:MAG: permease [Alphaproteobacteria bacterium]|nr:permease [Alphaproteobacteria bacterium]